MAQMGEGDKRPESRRVTRGRGRRQVAPGRILTGRAGSNVDEDNSESVQRTPHGQPRAPAGGAARLGLPADIAKAVAFLASEQDLAPSPALLHSPAAAPHT